MLGARRGIGDVSLTIPTGTPIGSATAGQVHNLAHAARYMTRNRENCTGLMWSTRMESASAQATPRRQLSHFVDSPRGMPVIESGLITTARQSVTWPWLQTCTGARGFRRFTADGGSIRCHPVRDKAEHPPRTSNNTRGAHRAI